MGHHHQRAAARGAGGRPARRRPRRRGGSSARRAPAGRGRRPAAAASATRRRSPPDSAPRRVQPVEVDARRAAEQAGEHVADPGVAGPLVLGAVADARRARTVAPGARSSCLREHPDVQAAGARDPAGVGRPARPASSSSSVVLPSPLRPTTPIRVALGDAERHAVEQGARAVVLPHALEVDEVVRAISARPSRPTTRAPGTGRRPRCTVRHTPTRSARRRGRGRARRRATRNAHVGPEPETTAAERAVRRRRPRAPPAAGAASSAAAAGRSCSAAPRAAASPARSAAISSVVDPRLGHAASSPRSRSHSAYTAGVDSPPSASANTQWNCPRASAGVSCSPRPVPSAVPPCSANGTSLPSSAASATARRGPARCPRARRTPRAPRPRRPLPPAMPPATGIPLRMCDVHVGLDARGRAASAGGGRTARLLPSVGTPAVDSPSIRSVIPARGDVLAGARPRRRAPTAWKTVTRSW